MDDEQVKCSSHQSSSFAPGRGYSVHSMRLPTYPTSITELVTSRVPICSSTALKSCLWRAGNDVRNNDDQPRMQGLSSVEGKEVGPIIRNKSVVLLQNDADKLPIFRTAETEIVDVVRN